MTQRLPKSSRRSRSLSQQRLLGYRLRQQRLKRRRMLMEQLEVRHLLAADSLLELPANSRQVDVQPLQNDAQPLQNETQTLQNDALPLRASQLIEQASLTESIAIQAALQLKGGQQHRRGGGGQGQINGGATTGEDPSYDAARADFLHTPIVVGRFPG